MDIEQISQLELFKETLTSSHVNDAIKRHPKMSFEDLRNELSRKKILFNSMDEKRAMEILTDLNYYYKLTVYRRNFVKDKHGEYVNLEFSTLADLASVDMQLRYLLLAATLDIEHAMKTFLITAVTNNSDINGYEIVERFFHSTIGTEYETSKEKILEKVRHKSHYQRELYEAHKDAPSVWVLVEVMNFGEFLRLFEFYFRKYPTAEFDSKAMSGILNAVKRVRNCCAHNNAFLFYLSRNEITHINTYISKYSENAGVGKAFYSCTKVHDVIAVIFSHDFFVKGLGSRKHRQLDLMNLAERSLDRFAYLENDNDIIYFFKALKLILLNYEVERRNIS